VAEIFTDNNFKVKYFDAKNKETGDGVVSDVQLEAENNKIEDVS